MLNFYSESPKFLVNVGRNEDAVNVLKRMYVTNQKTEREYPVRILMIIATHVDIYSNFQMMQYNIPISISGQLTIYYILFIKPGKRLSKSSTYYTIYSG